MWGRDTRKDTPVFFHFKPLQMDALSLKVHLRGSEDLREDLQKQFPGQRRKEHARTFA